jgi:hypothetical protein
MSDPAQIELIKQIPATIIAFGTLVTAIVSLMNRRIMLKVDKNVDGNATKQMVKLEDVQALLMDSKVSAARLAGMKEQLDKTSDTP